MHNTSTEVTVKAIEPNKRILIEWGDADKRTNVEWIFTARQDNLCQHQFESRRRPFSSLIGIYP